MIKNHHHHHHRFFCFTIVFAYYAMPVFVFFLFSNIAATHTNILIDIFFSSPSTTESCDYIIPILWRWWCRQHLLTNFIIKKNDNVFIILWKWNPQETFWNSYERHVSFHVLICVCKCVSVCVTKTNERNRERERETINIYFFLEQEFF